MRIAVLVVAVLVLAGCGGSTEPTRVPDVRGQRLDLAEARLEARGLRWEEIGGGAFGVILRSHWYVEEQIPKPGTRATTVKLVVERGCDDDDWDDCD
jgi:beta-lactam-binding protein with PASTA domain